DAHFLAVLVNRSSANPRPQSDRPYSRNEFREYGQAIGQNRSAQVSRCTGERCGHSAERPPPLRAGRRERPLPPSEPPSADSLPSLAKGEPSSSVRPPPDEPSPSGLGTSAFIER